MVPALPTVGPGRGYSARMSQIRVVLAEDGDLLRAGVLALLDGFDDIDVVATATNLPELLAAVDEHRPDVLLTDIRMPPDFTDEGIRAATELRRTHPGTGVVALRLLPDGERNHTCLPLVLPAGRTPAAALPADPHDRRTIGPESCSRFHTSPVVPAPLLVTSAAGRP